MKFHLFLGFDILPFFLHSKPIVRYASMEAVKDAKAYEKVFKLRKPKKKPPFTPVLKNNKLQALDNICGVLISLNHVSWARISIKNLVVTNWDAWTLPMNVIKDISVDLSVAYTIKKKIPTSDLYVTEKPRKWGSSINEIYLNAMLAMLLSFQKDDVLHDKVIFLRSSVFNNVNNLLVGHERKSARPIIKSILEVNKTEKQDISNVFINPYWYSLVKIPEEQHNSYISSSLEKQESLSLALLVALSFLNVTYYKNIEKSRK